MGRWIPSPLLSISLLAMWLLLNQSVEPAHLLLGGALAIAAPLLARPLQPHGYARLRYLKDRDGDLPIGETLELLYDKENGYRADPRNDESDEAIENVFLSLFCGFKVEQGTVFSGTGQNPGQKCGFRKRQIFRFRPEKGMCRGIDAPCSVTEIYSIEIFLENGIL